VAMKTQRSHVGWDKIAERSTAHHPVELVRWKWWPGDPLRSASAGRPSPRAKHAAASAAWSTRATGAHGPLAATRCIRRCADEVFPPFIRRARKSTGHRRTSRWAEGVGLGHGPAAAALRNVRSAVFAPPSACR
jgi:hypothetical protein